MQKAIREWTRDLLYLNIKEPITMQTKFIQLQLTLALLIGFGAIVFPYCIDILSVA